MNTIGVGNIGEQAAAEYLQTSGYELLERKYRLKIGEIDIIAQINNTLVFVEVKTRSNITYGFPGEAVTYRKQQKIINTALYYLTYINSKNTCYRFDVIEIFLKELRVIKYNHIIDAFST